MVYLHFGRPGGGIVVGGLADQTPSATVELSYMTKTYEPSSLTAWLSAVTDVVIC